MAVAIGNILPLLDLATHTIIPDRVIRTTIADRKTRSLPSDVVLNLFWRDPHLNPYFESVFDHKERQSNRGKSNQSKLNEVGFESSSDDENGNGFEDELGDEEEFDWEKEMRMRVKEIEDMRELEKKAEELQYKVDRDYEDGDGDGDGEQKEETEEQKRMRVKKELQKVAREQAEQRKTAQLMFELGQRAYERGTYARAIEFLEAALTIIPRPTLFGGEIQIWLAMAYEANNRHADCIAMYQQLEKKHPCVSIRRQAAELRYILQAPKLKITQEEMVTIPLIGSSYDSYAGTWSDKYKDKDQRLSGSTTNQQPSNKDYLGDLMVWKPPIGLEKNQAFWVSLTLWVGLVGAALLLQK
ncbi:hypothetical protein CASFOL_020940 [Castilleja foliolosa]|uniref:Uncharacterized protein n=1 Tax=Castilleja foliolosa TaxID=1961234 RepID=A0ABD3D316_9LAMI